MIEYAWHQSVVIVGVSSTWTFHKASITPTAPWSEGALLKLYASVFQGNEMKKIQGWHYQGSERTRFSVWFLGWRQMRLPSTATVILTKLVECTLWFLYKQEKARVVSKTPKKKHTLFSILKWDTLCHIAFNHLRHND